MQVLFWRDGKQLDETLASLMKTVLGLEDGNKCYLGFDRSLGLADCDNPEVSQAERWQILSPVKSHEFGTTEINRKIQAKYRGGIIERSRRYGPRPFGEQEIVWTDKVIQVFNREMKAWPPGVGLDYVANGEIGLAVNANKKPDSLDVGFSTQPKVTYRYNRKGFDDNLELAYALTIHKAQGSDFDIVFLILPKTTSMLSRELLNTGLTRFRQKMVLLIERDTAVLEALRRPDRSDTLLRNSSLFVLAVRPESVDRYYAEHLIRLPGVRLCFWFRKQLIRTKNKV